MNFQAGTIPSQQVQERLRRIVWLVCGLGLVLRVIAYAQPRDLWMDEAMLGLNILTKSFRELGQSLEYMQAAPMLFLWSTKAVSSNFGTSENALRLLPFLASFASVPCFYWLTRRVLRNGSWPQVFAVCLFAFSPSLISYAAQFKPYAWDVLCSILLLGTTLQIGRNPDARMLVTWGLLLVIAPWVSFASIFVVTPAVALVLGMSLLQRRYAQLVRLSLPAIAGVVSFAISYLVFTKPRLEQTRILESFDFAYLPAPGFTLTTLKAFYTSLVQPLVPAAGVISSGLMVLMVFLAVMKLRSRRVVLLGLLPLMLGVLFSLAHRYPWVDRCILYSVPGLILVMALGLQVLLTSTLRHATLQNVISVTVLVVSCGWLILEDGVNALRWKPQHGISKLMETLSRNHAGATVFIDNWSSPTFLFYHRLNGYGKTLNVQLSKLPLYAPDTDCVLEIANQQFTGSTEFWYVFPDYFIGQGVHASAMLKALNRHDGMADLDAYTARAFRLR